MYGSDSTVFLYLVYTVTLLASICETVLIKLFCGESACPIAATKIDLHCSFSVLLSSLK